MATATPTANIWRYTINLRRAGQKAQIGFSLRNVGAPANTDYFNFCNSILVGAEAVGKIYGETKALLVSAWEITDHRLQAVAPLRLVPLIRQPGGAPAPGTLSGISLPINTQAAITRHSAVARRWGISVLKPPFGSAGWTPDRASWDPALIVMLQAWGDLTLQNMVGATPGDILQPVVYSSGAVADAPELRVATVNPYLRVMRRRTVGLGE